MRKAMEKLEKGQNMSGLHKVEPGFSTLNLQPVEHITNYFFPSRTYHYLRAYSQSRELPF
jgi:hypothetical protein